MTVGKSRLTYEFIARPAFARAKFAKLNYRVHEPWKKN